MNKKVKVYYILTLIISQTFNSLFFIFNHELELTLSAKATASTASTGASYLSNH
jgi:hypothetical protein